MHWTQIEILLTAKTRGFHLITGEIEAAIPELQDYSVGLAHVFIKHTSASLVLNENADPTVRQDMEWQFTHMIPDHEPHYRHVYEGPDDMPAHIKSVLLGSSVSIPIKDGRLNLGTWQGIYLCEHRNRGGRRRLVITLSGQTS